jgi:hypothetical protein
MPADVPVSALDLGAKLGSGGQGEVFQVRNRPGEVFKRYLSPAVNAAALTALVAFPESLEERDREVLRRQTAWPLARVTDNARVIGFLMREVPTSFYGTTRAGSKLRELQYLLYPRKPLWGDIIPLDTTGRVEVALEFVRLGQILQGHAVVIGDISMRNVLWAHGFPAQIYLIDCDGCAVGNGPPVLPQPETPDWTDPKLPPTGADLDTDRYKVALLVGRVLAANAEVRPGRPLSLPPDLPATIARRVTECFQAAAGGHGSRPTATQWALALSGRETIALPPHPGVRAPGPALPKANLSARTDRERGLINLSPPDGRPA